MSGIRFTAILLSMTAALSGCAERPRLHEGADQVHVAKNDPPAGSVYVTEISAQDGSGCGLWGQKGTYANAVTVLRNEALKVGADYVQIMGRDTPNLEYGCYDNSYRIDATAYRTPNAPPTYEQQVYRLGAQPQAPSTTQVSATAAPAAPAQKSKDEQIFELQQRNLPYEQYQQEYRRIMGR